MTRAELQRLINAIPKTINSHQELYDWFATHGVSKNDLRIEDDAVFVRCDDPPIVDKLKTDHIVVVEPSLLAGIKSVLVKHFDNNRDMMEGLMNVWIVLAKETANPGQFRLGLEWASRYVLNASDVTFIPGSTFDKGDNNAN